MIHHRCPDDAAEAAAVITLIMLRFAQDALPAIDFGVPIQGKRGESAFQFFPDGTRLHADHVVGWMIELPKLVLVAALMRKGDIGIWRMHDLRGRAKRVAEHGFLNQIGAVDVCRRSAAAPQAANVLLETAAEEMVFPLGVLREWARNYGAFVGWSVGGLEGDPRADLRLNLLRGDGTWTPGMSCPSR